jgi:hypothetical protein
MDFEFQAQPQNIRTLLTGNVGASKRDKWTWTQITSDKRKPIDVFSSKIFFNCIEIKLDFPKRT